MLVRIPDQELAIPALRTLAARLDAERAEAVFHELSATASSMDRAIPPDVPRIDAIPSKALNQATKSCPADI